MKSVSPKRVFFSGQTSHITIEEEHPGGEDEQLPRYTEDEAVDDEDFNNTGVTATGGSARRPDRELKYHALHVSCYPVIVNLLLLFCYS